MLRWAGLHSAACVPGFQTGQLHACARPPWILIHSSTCCTSASCSPTAAQHDFRPAMPAHLPPGLASKAVSPRLCMSRSCSCSAGLNHLAGHAVRITMPGVGSWPARGEEGHSIHLLSMCCCSTSRAQVIEEVFENQRLQPFRGWGHSWPGHFLPTDKAGSGTCEPACALRQLCLAACATGIPHVWHALAAFTPMLCVATPQPVSRHPSSGRSTTGHGASRRASRCLLALTFPPLRRRCQRHVWGNGVQNGCS